MNKGTVFMRGTKMKALALSILCGFLTLSLQGPKTWAQTSGNETVSDALYQPQTIALYGRQVIVMPYQMEHTDYTWDDVKDYLPVTILEIPEEPKTYHDIYVAVQGWKHLTYLTFQDELREAGSEYVINGNPLEFDNHTDLEEMLLDIVHSKARADESPELTRYFKRALSVYYLSDMLADAFGYERTVGP